MAENKPFGRLPFLDGLRAVSILTVCASHYLSDRFPGGLGVTAFFFISGFLIASLMLVERHRTGRIAMGAFYARRLLRLLPALYVCVLIVALAYWRQYHGIDLRSVAAAFGYFYNYAGLFWDHLYPIPLWSLAIEEHFYLGFPLAFAVLLRKSPSRAFLAFAGLALLVLGWRIVLTVVFHAGANRIYVGTDTRIDSILFGVLLALLAHDPGWRQLCARWMGQWVMVVGMLLLLMSVGLRGDEFRQTWRYSLQGLAILLVIGPMVLGRAPGWVMRFLACAPAVYIGRISYSLYLYHLTVLEYVRQYHGGSRMLAAAITVVLACGSYHLIERPLLKARSAFGSYTAG